jgi:outer membrane receptor for monomeric catechols
MSKLSKKEFLENHSSFPSFHKKVLEQGDVEWKLLKENPQDYYAANSGSVPGMIYYTDTVAFAKKYHLSILQILDEFETEYGKLENKPSPTDEVQYFNWLSWFAWESMMSELIVYVEK